MICQLTNFIFDCDITIKCFFLTNDFCFLLYIVEMCSFTQQNNQAELTWSWLVAILLIMINSVIGEALGLALGWQIGLAVGFGLIPLEYGFIGENLIYN